MSEQTPKVDFPAAEYPPNWDEMSEEDRDAWFSEWFEQACRAQSQRKAQK